MEGEPRSRLTTKQLVNLASQQRHLRHLTCIFGRNIDPSLLPVVKSGCKSGLFCLFFTLHTQDDKTEIYRSETIGHSLNPSWNEFDFCIFPETVDHASSNFIVRIWASRRRESFRVIIKWHVDLFRLTFFGDQLKPRGRAYETDTLIFKMFGQYYTYSRPSETQTETKPDDSIKMILKVDQEAVSWAYKKSSLLRVHCTLKAVHETKQQVRNARLLIEEDRKCKENKCRKHTEKECLHRKIHLLKEELEILKEKVEVESNNTIQRRQQIEIVDKDLSSRQFELEQYVSSMKIRHSAHIDNRETLLKVNAQLNYRRKQLAAELSYIFPVVEIPEKEYGKNGYAITGVRLPISDALAGEDDEMLSVALGNTCHLVAMMAKLMELPLRYPIRPMGSRSSILDLVKDRLTDKEREFPLFLKGREKYQFHYGVYLLNKDIAQLRYHCGVGTSDLRQTLFNLKHLFANKFGIRIVIRPDTDTLQQRISQVPPERTTSERSEASTPAVPINSGKTVESSFERPRSYHDNKIDIFESIHKSKSHGDLNKKEDKLSAPSNRTQMHKLINRKSKKKSGRGTSLSDPASPNTADLLLEVPFEDMLKHKGNPVRTNTGEDLKDGHHNNIGKPDNPSVSENNYHKSRKITDNLESDKMSVDSGNSKVSGISKGYANGACLECLRVGAKCTDCANNKQMPVSTNDVHFDESDRIRSISFDRQYSEILLIPGPFDDHKHIAAIDE